MLEVRGFAEKVKGELARQGVRAALLFLALLSCHDAPRDNPFDPALTPPVELRVALDDTAGTATLTWTPYEGQQPFREYRVLRHIAERTRVDTLAHLPAVEQTAFVDTTLAPNTAYVYRVEVVNVGGYAASSEEKGVAGFSVGAVRLGGVEPNPGTGELVLRWRRYVGADFSGYQVRRRVVGTDQEEVLAELSAAVDTSLVDSSAQAGVDYLYMVVVEAAGQALLSNAQEARLILPPVEITRADFSSAEASANLAWTRYRGPHFKTYQVWRRTAELAAQVIAEKSDTADTSLVDPGLLGNTEYFYRVVVVTERGEEVEGEEKGGAFHRLLATWPIGGGIARPFVRLYRREEGVSALVFQRYPLGVPDRLELLTLDLEGQLQKDHLLASDPYLLRSQRAIALASSLDGRRFLSVMPGYDSREMGVLAWGADGQQIVQELPVFGDAFPQPFGGPEGIVLGEIAMLGSGRFQNVAVSAQGRLLFSEDFRGSAPGWDLGGGSASSAVGTLYSPLDNPLMARRADESWKDFRLEADVAPMAISSGIIGIRIGGDTFSHLSLQLDRENQQVILDWSFVPPPDQGLEPRTQQLTAPLAVVGFPAYYRLGLEMVGGQVRASVRTPLLWGGVRPPSLVWTSLATIGNTLALTVYDQPYTLTQDGAATALPGFGNGVSEIRAWQDRRGRQQLGVCLPEANKLLFGSVPAGQEADWPAYLTKGLGPGLGLPSQFLFYPLSFDVGPDGRFYILDSGNARIVVFNSQWRYVTQWGAWGNGEGEFDFGLGNRSPSGELDFAGSLAVDDQGYIYVCDEINGRIQKFAP